jgi:uncharacterized protein YbjT (DUF2867 family)
MSKVEQPILVFGATGQQGGSVTKALLSSGWRVRALVRNLQSDKALALQNAEVELVKGDLNDPQTIREAMNGAYGVFSVQPSSGQGALYGVSDEDEVHYGIQIADIAVESGVHHLVYSSTDAIGDTPTGMRHFDSKARIEKHIRTLPVTTTIVRPAAFMEMLLMPGFGLDEGRFNFFMQPEQSMQLLALEDLGHIVAAVFAEPGHFGGTTLAVASDDVTGQDIEAVFSEVAGRQISYSRFDDDVLANNAFLAKLTELLDTGVLAGTANLDELRSINPQLKTFRSWLAGSGRSAFIEALGTSGEWGYGHD